MTSLFVGRKATIILVVTFIATEAMTFFVALRDWRILTNLCTVFLGLVTLVLFTNLLISKGDMILRLAIGILLTSYLIFLAYKWYIFVHYGD